MKIFFGFLLLTLTSFAQAEKITIVAASDLKFAFSEIVSKFKQKNPNDNINIIYGSSGKFYAQIRQNAPFDLYFSADINYPRKLAKEGFAGSKVMPYALGRIVLWSASLDASKMTMANLTDDNIKRIAIANPKHAPYGKRAVEALKSAKIYNEIRHKLVYGENIANTAHFVTSGNAQVGILALSLVLNPNLLTQNGYWLIPNDFHQPLEQGFIITKRAQNNKLAYRFFDYIKKRPSVLIMEKYGFVSR